MSYLFDEIQRWPLRVSMGSIITGKMAASAPFAPIGTTVSLGPRRPITDPTDVIGVTLTPLTKPHRHNPQPTPMIWVVTSWTPKLFYGTNAAGVWGVQGVAFPQIGDAMLLNFDEEGQLWALDWTANYKSTVGAG